MRGRLFNEIPGVQRSLGASTSVTGATAGTLRVPDVSSTDEPLRQYPDNTGCS
jgi:hypothetical protein